MLRVGVLEPGGEHNGIRRYGEVLAAALDGDEVRASGVTLTPNATGMAAIRDAREVLRALRGHDVALIPYSRHNIWSPGPLRVLQLAIVLLGLRRRAVTVLHDVYPPGWPQRVEWWALTVVLLLSGRVVTHSADERARLRRVPGAGRVRVIAHFVLEREPVAREHARAAFGVAAQTPVVGMVGLLNPRKNLELAIEALARLPAPAQLWLIGGPGRSMGAYQERLRRLVADRGLTERVTITGAVSEQELTLRLAAIDVGACPYRRISASGSISTLLGARRPLVATDAPFTRELWELSPDAVRLLDALAPAALADALAAVLAGRPGPEAFDPILGQRSVRATAERYLVELRAAAGPARRAAVTETGSS